MPPGSSTRPPDDGQAEAGSPHATYAKLRQHPSLDSSHASTSYLPPTPPHPLKTSTGRPRKTRERRGECWCGSAPVRRQPLANSAIALAAAAAFVSTVPLASATIVVTPPPPFPRVTGIGTLRRRLAKRDSAVGNSNVPLLYTPDEDGSWTPSYNWTLRGRTGKAAATNVQGQHYNGMQDATVEDDAHLDVLADADNSSSAAAASATSSAATPHWTAASSAAASSTSSFTVPAGWQPRTRTTSLYAVPVIIACSVVLAVLVIGAMIGCVVWRKKVKHAAEASKDPEKTGGAGEKKRRRKKRRGATGTAAGGGGGLRRRRRRGEGLDEEDDDAMTVLTGTVAEEQRDSGPRSTARPDSLAPSASLSRQSSRTSTVPSRLTRSASNASIASRHSLAVSTTSPNLGQPADYRDAPLSSPSRSPSTAFPDIVLPAMGPPAYRPSGSTIQETTRLSRSLLPSRQPTPSVEHEQEDTAWHWPGEKHSADAHASTSTSSRYTSRVPPPPIEVEPTEEEREERMEGFRAHVATDDKAVLERLRSAAATASSSSSSSAAAGGSSSSGWQPVEPSAPTLEDDDLDEEGFERYDVPSSSGGLGTVGLLPPPSQPVVLASFAGEQDSAPVEEHCLPVYVHSSRRREIEEAMATASAPPPDMEDEEEEEAVDRMEGRELHTEV